MSEMCLFAESAAHADGVTQAADATSRSSLLIGRVWSIYVFITSMSTPPLDRELKKGSAELIILSILETRARHGYEICKLIEQRSNGSMKFHVASLYPLLYRLEERGWLHGKWVEKAGERRRRFYSLTAEGRRVLASQRDTWKAFVRAMELITGPDNA